MKKQQQNIGLSTTVDTIRLSDAFRRRASYTQHQAAKDMVKQAWHFAAATTWYHPHETMFHKRVKEHTLSAAQQMADAAVKMGATEVILPVTGDNRSAFTKFFRKEILPQLAGLPVTFRLQDGIYKEDLSHLGPIDRRFKTALDKGLRGMADINDNLKYKWDANPRP